MSALDNVIYAISDLGDGYADREPASELAQLRAELAALREENLKLSAGDYLLREIGEALNCAPDATILQRVAEQDKKFDELHKLSTELVNALGYWLSLEQEPQECLNAELALGEFLAANPAPQKENTQ